MVDVVVLGAGPTGLIAAWAAQQSGAKVQIVSVKKKSELFGCQYLHAPVPNVSQPQADRTVTYTMVGDPDAYEAKVYGGVLRLPPTVSSRTLAGTVAPAWDLRAAYAQLWEHFEGSIVDREVGVEDVMAMRAYYNPRAIFSSLPLPTLCAAPGVHAFLSASCWALGDAPALGQTVPIPCPDDTVVCNAEKDVGYYRVARVFDHTTAEWPGWRPRPPLKGVVPFKKPVATTCTCWQGIVTRIGRYGTWTKGVLAHEAYDVVRKELA